jgi:hypothetical protein
VMHINGQSISLLASSILTLPLKSVSLSDVRCCA